MKYFFSKLFGGYKTAQQKFVSYPTQAFSSSLTSNIDPKRALYYYETVAPVNTAIDIISDEIAGLDIVLQEQGSEELIYMHPALDLLEKPNADVVRDEFMKQLAAFYLLTGNAYIVASGPVNRPPLELAIVNPTSVEVKLGDDGYAQSLIIWNQDGSSIKYDRKEVDGRFRYYHGGDLELWHIRSFSPGYGRGEGLGLSPLAPIALEIEQYIEASIHNLSLLKRGARPSGAVKVTEMLTDDQYQRLQNQLERFYSGSHNAGRSMILEGGDFIQMSQSNKDMDFAELKRTITETIYRSLNIPLVMVSTSAATYNNLELAQLSLYDNSVLPVMDRLLLELTTMLMYRFERKRSLRLVYDKDEITALEPRRTEQVRKLKETGVLTVNEIRRQIGYEPVPGGDTLYINSNQVPLDEVNLADSLDQAKKLMTEGV